MSAALQVTYEQFQKQILAVEGVQLSLYLKNGRLLPAYPYREPVGPVTTLGELLQERVRRHLPKGCAVDVVLGDGTMNPNIRMQMQYIRKTYGH